MNEDIPYAENAKQRLKASLLHIGVFMGTLLIVIGPIANPAVGLGICTAVTLTVYAVHRFLQGQRSSLGR